MRKLDGIIADLEHFPTVSELFELFGWLMAKVQRSGFDSLTGPGQTIVLVQLYDGGMCRGGFDTLLRWEPQLGIMPMVAALEEVGAHQTAAVLVGLASLFPSGAIPDDAELRCREYNDHVLLREKDMEQVQENLRRAEREEDVSLLSAEYACRNSTNLRAEDTEPVTAPDPAA